MLMARERKARRSSLGLIILWLLWDGPKHVYGMQKLIEQQGKHRIVNVRSRASLYQTIERLVRLELVRVQETVRADTRPERIVYSLTDEGRATAQQWLRDTLSATGEEFPEFVAALSIVFGLEPGEARAELELRVERLEAELAQVQRALRSAPGLPRLFLLEEEYRRAMLRAELKWLRGVIADLDSGALSWTAEWLEGVRDAFTSTDDVS
jgi:DNA-binding PadR family transcriptional regulator